MTVMVVCLQVARDLERMRSEPLRPQQGVGEVKQQAYRDETGERIIEDHGRSPSGLSREAMSGSLEPFASVGVTHRQYEEAQTEGQHDDIQHEVLLVALVPRATLRACREKAGCIIGRGSELRSSPAGIGADEVPLSA
jgi:hypothetical protein